jgi:hypothetical protein
LCPGRVGSASTGSWRAAKRAHREARSRPNGIIINAGPNDVVELRGFNLDGLGTAATGIRIMSAGSVHISKSVIRGFTENAIRISPTANPVTVYVADTTITNNATGILAGATAPATSNVMVDRVIIENTRGSALRATGSNTMRVSNSVVTNNNRGVHQGGNARIVSMGNNTLVFNTTDGVFDSVVPLQ